MSKETLQPSGLDPEKIFEKSVEKMRDLSGSIINKMNLPFVVGDDLQDTLNIINKLNARDYSVLGIRETAQNAPKQFLLAGYNPHQRANFIKDPEKFALFDDLRGRTLQRYVLEMRGGEGFFQKLQKIYQNSSKIHQHETIAGYQNLMARAVEESGDEELKEA